MPVAAQSSILSLSPDAPEAISAGTPAAEMFGGLIVALAASGVRATVTADAAVPTTELPATIADPAAPAADGEPAAAADQLLALSCAMPAQAQLLVRKPGAPVEARTSDGEDLSEADTDMKRCETDVQPDLTALPIAMIPTPNQSVATAPALTEAPQVEADPQPVAFVGQAKAGPVLAPPTALLAQKTEPSAKAAEPAPDLAKFLQPNTADPAQVTNSNADAAKPVQEAIRALLAQELPTASRAKPAKIEAEASAVIPALKLGAAPFTPTAFSVAEIAPRVAVPLETAVPVEPETGELLIEHQLDMTSGDEWLDSLAKDIARSAGDTPLRFRLNPENLGSLRVEIANDRGGASVRLTADTETARAIIADAQPRLIAEARAQGVRIAEAHVELGQQPGSDANRRHSEGPHEPQLRTARSVQEDGTSDGKPTRGSSERYA